MKTWLRFTLYICSIALYSRYVNAIDAAHEHVGLDDGFDTRFEGFVCEQPAAYPPTVSSTAALYASPQFGSL